MVGCGGEEHEPVLECIPSGPTGGCLSAWRSKPETQRLYIAASLASGTSVIETTRLSHETNLMQVACESLLGARFNHSATGSEVTGSAPSADVNCTIECNGSALVARVSIALASLIGGSVHVTGNRTLVARPMAPLFQALEGFGGSFEFPERRYHLPVTVKGRVGRGGPCSLSGETSSQFLTALLFAAPLFPDGLWITPVGRIRSRPYLAMTLTALQAAGISVSISERDSSFYIPQQTYSPFQVAVGADYTSCSYFMAAAAMSGGSVTITGLNRRTQQGEHAILGILQSMGASVTFTGSTCVVQGGTLTGNLSIDATDFPNIIPTVAALAAVAPGVTEVRGGEVTNFHKSPRVVAIVDQLRTLDVDAEVLREDDVPVGFRIRGKPSYPGGVTLDACEDHRLAKAFSLLSLRTERALRIRGIATQRAMLEQYVGDCCALGLRLRLG